MFEEFYCEACGEHCDTIEVIPASEFCPAYWATEPPDHCEECGNDTFDSETEYA